MPVVEHVPPSENAAKFWLQNRAPREWNAAHNVNLSSTLDVTITKDTSPKDAMAEFMKLLATPAAALVIEHEAIAPEPEPPGDANGSDWGGHAATEARWRAKAGPDARFTPSAHPRGPAAS